MRSRQVIGRTLNYNLHTSEIKEKKEEKLTQLGTVQDIFYIKVYKDKFF